MRCEDSSLLVRTFSASKSPRFSISTHEVQQVISHFSCDRTLTTCGSSIQSVWFTIAVWRTLEAPRFKPGFIFASTLGVAIFLLSLLIRFLQLRDEKNYVLTKDGTSDTEATTTAATNPETVADGAISDVLKGEGVNIAYP